MMIIIMIITILGILTSNQLLSEYSMTTTRRNTMMTMHPTNTIVLSHTTAATTTTTKEEQTNPLNQLCQWIAGGHGAQQNPSSSYLLPSIGSIWMREQSKIREALLHAPANQPFGSRTTDLQTIIDQIIPALPLEKIRRSVRYATFPSNDQKLHRIVDILWKRRFNADTNNPPLQVLVFGGSPTAGSNCERNGRLKKQGHCAWPGHLQDFVNRFLGYDAIRVVNYAIGASKSDLATMILKLRLFPQSMLPHGPDVIINAYAVNDYSWLQEGSITTNDILEPFVEAVQELSDCDNNRPLVIMVDDKSVDVSRQGRKHGLTNVEKYRSELYKLAQYYQIYSISFVDVIQDYLYSASNESSLLIDWQNDSVHIPWAGHVAMVYLFAYNVMTVSVGMCEDNAWLKHGGGSQQSTTDTIFADDVDHRRQNENDAIFRPRMGTTTLDDIPSQWNQNIKDHCDEYRRGSTAAPRVCPFAWVALRKETEHEHMPDVNDILVRADGWKYDTTWPPTNYGFYGSTNGTAVFRVNEADNTNTTSDIMMSTVTIIYMKSYSKKWFNSLVNVTVLQCQDVVASKTISGFHEKQTSEYYTETISWEPSALTTVSSCPSVELELRMISGSTFRIGGLSFC